MPSRALTDWSRQRSARLDRLLDAHRAVGGSGRGRRWITAELNHALIVRLASEFQGFCRDAHDEAIEAVVRVKLPDDDRLASLLRSSLERGRALDRGNASWGNVVDDFGRFGLSLSDELQQGDVVVYRSWTQAMDRLNGARNAIAHDDRPKLAICEAQQRLTLATFKAWRRTIDQIAHAMDEAIGAYLMDMTGEAPWEGGTP